MSNFSNSAAQVVAKPLESKIETPSTPVSPLEDLKRIDLRSIQLDKSFSLHKLLESCITEDSCFAVIEVMNFDQVYISDAASQALERCYITPAFMLDRFASQYKENILVEVTRGNLKGMKYINSNANEYSHLTEDGMEIVVTGRCVEINNGKIRQIHITSRNHALGLAVNPVVGSCRINL
jgi:hypothetical protein